VYYYTTEMPFLKKKERGERRGGIRNIHNVMRGKPEEKKAAKRLKYKQQNNTEVNL
jgi:hypothetical protein